MVSTRMWHGRIRPVTALILAAGMAVSMISATAAQEGSPSDGQLKVDPFKPAVTSAVLLPEPPEGMLTVKINLPKYLNALPGEMEVHVPEGDSNRLWKTSTVGPGEEAPVGARIDDGIAFVKPGEMALVTLVYKNPTMQDIRIRTVAPFVDPAVATSLAYGRCWCDAAGFDVPAQSTWYRTIGVGVATGAPVGAKVIVTWPVIVVSTGE